MGDVKVKSVSVVAAMMGTSVPKPKPGSKSKKYSILVRLGGKIVTGIVSFKNGLTATVLHLLLASLARTLIQCIPLDTDVIGMEIAKLFTNGAAVKPVVTKVPKPKPGSLSIKYSTRVIRTEELGQSVTVIVVALLAAVGQSSNLHAAV